MNQVYIDFYAVEASDLTGTFLLMINYSYIGTITIKKCSYVSQK